MTPEQREKAHQIALELGEKHFGSAETTYIFLMSLQVLAAGAIKAIVAAGGGDEREAHLSALEWCDQLMELCDRVPIGELLKGDN